MAPIADNSLSEETRTDLENFVTNWMEAHEVPGASLAVVDGDETVYSAGFGAKDLESNTAVTSETLFGIGSATKSFTAVAIMQLVEQGYLTVNDPVADHVDRYEGTDITIRDLMTHSSGMPSDGSAVVLISRLVGLDPVEVPMSSFDDFARHLRESNSERLTDRDRFFYYNSGYTVLGEVIEAVTGQSYEAFIKESILTPLGMERSTFDWQTFEDDGDRMTPYYKENGNTTEGEFPFDEIIYAPGGLLSSVDELTGYLRFQMNGGAVDGQAILDSSLVSEMHEPVSTRRVSLSGTPQEYGYGWMVSDFLDDTLVGHGGSITVSTAYIGFLKDAGVGIAVACQSQPAAHPMVLGPALLAITQGADPVTAVPHFALAEKNDLVAGDYSSYRGVMDATVENTGGCLQLTLSTRIGEQTVPLIPETTDPDDLRYYTVDGLGDRVPAEFRETDGGLELLYERWRLHGR